MKSTGRSSIFSPSSDTHLKLSGPGHVSTSNSQVQAMRAYLYHIRLEVYKGASDGVQGQPAFLPSPGLDIFSALPIHQTTHFHRSIHNHPVHPAAPRIQGNDQPHSNALLLPERNSALNRVRHQASRPLARPSEDTATRDWRFGPVSIDTIDMGPAVEGISPAGKAPSERHTKALYIPSDVKTTQIGNGIVHLYKDLRETDLLTELQQRRQDNAPIDLEQCTTLCILAVPSWMMPSDLLGFVGDQTRTDVSHFRLVRTGRTNKYMVLMKFRSARRACEWQKAWNGRLFSAMEPENCHVVFVRSVDFVTQSADATEGAGHNSFPLNTHDSFLPTTTTYTSPLVSSAKPYAPPTPSLIELPTCPVCLERMDETTGLLTILCQHVFHCACLEKWRGSGCPVCRYTQSPSYTFPYPRPNGEATKDEDDEPLCSVCASSTNLWICLICGNTGCGRYDSAHAHAHYEATSHCYAMDIRTQRVWDYVGDGYVHRLIQNKDDDKLIRLPGARHNHPNSAFRAEGDDSVPREKMEAMANEYTFLLTNQLESQRRYFEEQLERAVDKTSTAGSRAEEAAAEANASRLALEDLQIKAASLEEAVTRLEQSLEKTKMRSDKFEKMSRDSMRQIREETAMNAGLMKRVTAAEDKASESRKQLDVLRVEMTELEETNRDLTIFISSQDKIRELREQGEQVEGADVTVPEQTRGKGKGRKKKA